MLQFYINLLKFHNQEIPSCDAYIPIKRAIIPSKLKQALLQIQKIDAIFSVGSLVSETFKNNIASLTKHFETVASPFDNFSAQEEVFTTFNSPTEKKPTNDGVKFFVTNGYQYTSAFNQHNCIRRISAINNPDIVCTAGKLQIIEEDQRLYIQPGSLTGVYENPSFVLITIKNKKAIVTTYELNTVTDEVQTTKFEIVREFNIMTEEECKEYEDQVINEISQQSEDDVVEKEKSEESNDDKVVKPKKQSRKNRFQEDSDDSSVSEEVKETKKSKKDEESSESQTISKKKSTKVQKDEDSDDSASEVKKPKKSKKENTEDLKKSKKSIKQEDMSDEEEEKPKKSKSRKFEEKEQSDDDDSEEVQQKKKQKNDSDNSDDEEQEQETKKSSKKSKKQQKQDSDDEESEDKEDKREKKHHHHHHHRSDKKRDEESS